MNYPNSQSEAQAKIPLEVTTVYDSESKMYFANFDLFPQAVAYDDTKEKAIQRLIALFNERVLKDRRDEVISKILESNFIKIDVERNLIDA